MCVCVKRTIVFEGTVSRMGFHDASLESLLFSLPPTLCKNFQLFKEYKQTSHSQRYNYRYLWNNQQRFKHSTEYSSPFLAPSTINFQN